QLGARRVDVVDAQRQRVRGRAVLHPELLRLHDGDREVAGLELDARHLAVAGGLAQPQRGPVELDGTVEVVGVHDEEVGTGDHRRSRWSVRRSNALASPPVAVRRVSSVMSTVVWKTISVRPPPRSVSVTFAAPKTSRSGSRTSWNTVSSGIS